MWVRLECLFMSCMMPLMSASLARGDDPTPQPADSPSSSTQVPASVSDPEPSTNRSQSGGFGGRRSPGYSVEWYPQSSVLGQGSDFSLVRQNLNVGMPVWRQAGDVLLLTFGAQNSLFFTDAILPDTLRPFPEHLWNVRFGLNYLHQFENGWKGGIMPFIGSASDRPFSSLQELNLGIIAFLRVPAHREQDAWNFSLFYDSASNLNFPIPGIAYSWNPSANLLVNVGIPFSLQWQPVEDLKVNVSWFPLTNVRTNVTWEVIQGFSVLVGYQFLTESWFLADRQRERDRFMGFEQRLQGGVRWNCWRNVNLDMTAGYVLDRYYGEGPNQGADLRDRIDVGPGAFLGASLNLNY